MEEIKVQSLLRQINETKAYVKEAEAEMVSLNQRLEAFECLLKDTIEKESAINLTGLEF